MRLLSAGLGMFQAGILAAALLAAPAALAQAAPDVIAPIAKFVDAFNTGDMQAAAATHVTDNVMIIDEVPPHSWTGAKALEAWAADYDKNAKATGVTDGIVKISKATRKVINGSNAYVIVPAHYTYKEKGKAMVEDGQMTFSLRLGADGWKIAAWTWSGPNPHAVSPKPKAQN